jgi:hypothetical protein
MATNKNIENNKHLKENRFRVPATYFRELESKLSEIPGKEAAPVIPLHTSTFFKRALAVAASLVIIVTATWQFLPKEEEITLSADDIIALTSNGYLPYSEMAFLEVVDTETLDTLNLGTSDLGTYYEETQPELIEYFLITDE